MSEIELARRLRDGRQIRQQEYRSQDVAKIGNLRAGNSGILTAEGHFAGCCPMESHIRQLGYTIEKNSDDKLIMFQGGFQSEDGIYEDLLKTLQPGEIIKREEEIPIVWTTKNGTKVTGRPDLVICHSDINLVPATKTTIELINDGVLIPKLGVEMKSVASMWTTCEILFEGQPKLNHVIQTAHYAWKLGTETSPLPFKLIYKQFSNQVVPKWKMDQYPPLPQHLMHCVEQNGKGTIKQVVPYEIVYDITTDKHGYVWFGHEGKRPTKSIVKLEDIERFYEFVSEIPHTGNLGEKLQTLDVVGKHKQYQHCDMYCTAHKLFGKYAHDYSLWLDHVRLYSDSLQKSNLGQDTK